MGYGTIISEICSFVKRFLITLAESSFISMCGLSDLGLVWRREASAEPGEESDRLAGEGILVYLSGRRRRDSSSYHLPARSKPFGEVPTAISVAKGA